jgi:hypothetical protein
LGTIVAVQQVPLEIPDEIYARVLTGEYRRVGGVIRDGAGQLVKLLDDASPIDDVQEAAKAGIGKVLSNRTVVGIGLGLVAVAATAGGAAYRAMQKTNAAQLELSTSVENYSDSLTAYLEAARHGSLDAGIIDRLIADLDAVKAELDSGTSTFEFSAEQSEALVGMVAGHTRSLVEANKRDLSNLPEPVKAQGATVIEIRPYLEAQRDIFTEAA